MNNGIRIFKGVGNHTFFALVVTIIAVTALLSAAFSSCKSKDSKPAAGLAALNANSFTSGNASFGKPFSGDIGERAVSSVEGPGGTTFHFEPLDGDDSPDRKVVFPSSPWQTDLIKAWDGQDTQWGFTRSGLLDPLTQSGALSKMSTALSGFRIAHNISYFGVSDWVDTGEDGIAFEFAFKVLTPHDEITISFIYGTNNTSYTNADSNNVYPEPWSAFDYWDDGQITYVIPAVS